jgi:hypothetical protein
VGRAVGDSRLVVAGFGHRGLGLAADGLRAGFDVTCVGPSPLRLHRLIGELSGDDRLAGVLQAGLGTGSLRLLDAPPGDAEVDVAVFAPDDGPEATRDPGPMELAAAALAAGVHARTHVVLFGGGSMHACSDVVTGTIGMLTGREPGRDYTLGYGIASGSPGAPTVVSGVDGPSARRTGELFRLLGHTPVTITPVEAAVFVAHLQRALLDPGGRRYGCPP